MEKDSFSPDHYVITKIVYYDQIMIMIVLIVIYHELFKNDDCFDGKLFGPDTLNMNLNL